MLKRASAFSITFVLLAPLLTFLAISPQSPDGAEMWAVATQGGVLHPSGMPLQAWLNQFAVWLLPGFGVRALSLVSWLGHWLSASLLLLMAMRLGAGWVTSVLAVLTYAYLPISAMMAVIPEKYSILSASVFLFLYLFLLFTEKRRPWRFLLLTLSLAVALAQHSAAVVLVPTFLVAVYGFFKEDRSWARVLTIAGFCALASLIVITFYMSLLWMRSEVGWPDWGRLVSAADVFHHLFRGDYSVTKLANSQVTASSSLSAFGPFVKSLIGLGAAALFVPPGFWVILRRRDLFSLGWVLGVVSVLALFSQTTMPLVVFDTVWGYQERYQMLLWPFLGVLLALGLSVLFRLPPLFNYDKRLLLSVACISCAYVVYQAQNALSGVNSKLVEIYRAEAAMELPSKAIFITMSDFVAFSGVPERHRLRYPLKSMFGFSWYRDEAALEIEPRMKKMMADLGKEPWTLADMARIAIRQGLTVAATEATAFLRHPDIMAVAEQRGVLWVFRKENRGLYTAEILQATNRACQQLPDLNSGPPADGQFFVREFLESYRYAFMGAGDYLESLQQPVAAAAAREVVAFLKPGVAVANWRLPCERYRLALAEIL